VKASELLKPEGREEAELLDKLDMIILTLILLYTSAFVPSGPVTGSLLHHFHFF